MANNNSNRFPVISGLVALTLAGALAFSFRNNHQKYLEKIDAVHSYVSANGPINFEYGNEPAEAFSDNGLGFEFNKRTSLKSAAYEAIVQGTSKFAKDVIKNSLGMRREGDKIDLKGERKLVEYSDSMVDHDLNGIGRKDTYREWKYNPTLEGKEDNNTSYVEKMRSVGKVAGDLIKSARGIEVDPLKEETVIVNKELSKEVPISNLSARKRDFIKGHYKSLVKAAYEIIN